MMLEPYQYWTKGCYEKLEVHVVNKEQVSSSVKSQAKQISFINKE